MHEQERGIKREGMEGGDEEDKARDICLTCIIPFWQNHEKWAWRGDRVEDVGTDVSAGKSGEHKEASLDPIQPSAFHFVPPFDMLIVSYANFVYRIK